MAKEHTYSNTYLTVGFFWINRVVHAFTAGRSQSKPFYGDQTANNRRVAPVLTRRWLSADTGCKAYLDKDI